MYVTRYMIFYYFVVIICNICTAFKSRAEYHNLIESFYMITKHFIGAGFY